MKFKATSYTNADTRTPAALGRPIRSVTFEAATRDGARLTAQRLLGKAKVIGIGYVR